MSRRRWSLALLLLAASCPKSTPHVRCTNDDQCSLPGRPAVCIDHVCAVASSSCPSGYRIDYRSEGSADCVPAAPDMAVGSGDDLATSTPSDMAVPPGTPLTWSPVSNPAADHGTTLRSISGLGPNEAWAVGDSSTVLYWLAGQWLARTAIQGPFPPALDSFTTVVAGPTSAECFIFDGHPRFQHVQSLMGASWTTLQPRSQQTTIDGATINSSEVWAVGTSDGIIHTVAGMSPTLVTGVDAVTPPAFKAVWSVGNDTWVVGLGGVIVHVTAAAPGGPWAGTQIATTSTADLFAVWAGAGDVWAAGAGGAVVHLVAGGGGWASAPSSSGAAVDLHGIWGSAGDDVWAVGDGGALLHWTGAAAGWQSAASGTSARLNAVWGSGPRDVWAVGDGGIILHGQ
jgi:hypothetical protein